MELLAPPLAVSADSPTALAAAARRLRQEVESTPDEALVDLSRHLLATNHGHHRGTVIAHDRPVLLRGLSALAESRTARGVAVGTADLAERPVLVFPGQSAPWAGMVTGLLESSPDFRVHLEHYVDALRPHVSFDVVAALTGGGADLSRLDVIQPVQFAVTSALADLWRDCGLRPAAVVGHSMGEVAAAHAAGALSRSDAAQLIGRRCDLLTVIEGQGAMASIAAPLERVRTLLSRWGTQLSISAVNSGRNITVSGDRTAVVELLTEAAKQNIWAWQVPGMTVAAHAPQVEALREQVLEEASDLTPHPPHTAFYSTVTGTRLHEESLTPAHWYRNLRDTVLFEQAVRTLIGDGHKFFIEVSAHPTLTTPLREILHSAKVRGVAIATLDRREDDVVGFVQALTHAFVNGAPINWETACAPLRQRHDAPGRNRPPKHPLLSHTVELAHTRETVFFGQLSLAAHPWLRDYTVHRKIVLPGTAVLDIVAYVGEHAGCRRVDELVLDVPLELPYHGERALQVVLSDADDTGARRMSLHSRATDTSFSSSWTCHASARVSPRLLTVPTPLPWPPRDAQPVDVADLHDRLAGYGYQLDRVFGGTTTVWRSGGTVSAEIPLPECRGRPRPAALNAALHACLLTANPNAGEENPPQAPSTWHGASLAPTGGDRLRIQLSPRSSGGFAVAAFDLEGKPVLTVDSIRFHPTRPNEPESTPTAPLNRMVPARQRDTLIEIISRETSAIVGHSSLASTQTFQDIGLDSATVVELSNRLATATGMPLPPTVVFDHPTPAALASHLLDQFVGGDRDSLDGLLAELDRITLALPHAVRSPGQRARVQTRLRNVLPYLEEAASDKAADRIRTATSEEILDVLATELGHSHDLESSSDREISHAD